MQTEIQKLKQYLKEERKDCLKLQKKNFLTKEGYGMLKFIDAIYDHMGWEY